MHARVIGNNTKSAHCRKVNSYIPGTYQYAHHDGSRSAAAVVPRLDFRGF